MLKGLYRNLILIIGIIVLGLIIIWGIYIRSQSQNLDADLTTVEQDRLVVTQTYPTQFVVYGTTMEFHDSIFVRYVDEICEDTLELQNDYEYEVIIINDLDGKVDLSNEEWEIVSKYVKSDARFSFFYLGDEEIAQIYELGIVSSLDLWEEGDLSIGLTHEGEQLITVFGTHNSNSKAVLTEVLIHEHVYSLKQSNAN